MNPNEKSDKAPFSFRRLTVALLVSGFGLTVLMPYAMAPMWITLWILATGWWSFLARTIPHVRFDSAAFSLGLLCTAIVLYGTHRLFRGLANHRHAISQLPPDPEIPRVWKIRWTVWINSLLALSFAIGMALIGVVHQTSWLLTSEAPLFKKNGRYQHFQQMGIVKYAHHAIRAELEKDDLDQSAAIRKVKTDYPPRQLSPNSDLGRHYLLFREDGVYEGALTILDKSIRTPQLSAMVALPETDGVDWLDDEQLSSVLDTYHDRMETY